MLFTPLRVGPLEVRNRIVFAAHLTNLAVERLPTAEHAAYYAARAEGGAGLIITEEFGTDPADRPYEKLVDGTDPAVVPAARRITDAVHAHGAAVLAQLNHNGGQSSGMHTREPVRAASPVPDPLFREVPQALTAAEIAGVVAGYARIAAHCAAAGFDGVEVQASQSSIVRGFLSPRTNLRTDAYGGPLRHRARILLEIVGAVRDALGPGRVLSVRIGPDDPGTLDETVELARLLAGSGRVDLLNTTVGVATASQHLITPPMRVPAGYALPIAAAVRGAVRLPVVGAGRLTDPREAERALAEGHCDLVAVVRGQIADPAFAAHARSGTRGHTCLGCNQECVGRVGLNRSLRCVTNPRAGRESAPLPAPAVAGRRVLVVGGGPGGLRAAATAARRGHRVTLCEREWRTGGHVALAASAPGRAGLRALVADAAAECRLLGVQVRTGVAVDAGFVRLGRYDAVVLATGARPARPAWAGRRRRVVDVRDVLTGGVFPSGAVLVHDELGHHAATSVAELLAARGCRVEITTPGMVVGPDLALTLDAEAFAVRAHALGIVLSPDRVILAAEPVTTAGGGVMVRVLHHPLDVIERRLCDWVVCAVPPVPDERLWHALRDGPVPVHRVGDCLAPRTAHGAVVEGERVGEQL